MPRRSVTQPPRQRLPGMGRGQTELERYRTTEGYTRVVGRPTVRGRVGQGPHGRGQILDRESFRGRPTEPMPRQVPSDHLEVG